ncbi:uncharacterized protein MAM_01068 [Metarhizium album ARSEF 1941]|uniref:Uncharacterized protein n=1 Tax=Metarhizium album (strain ARSEF 1941) TaxID=1081103 RepID=A0A0B2X0K3_METAS|nr:uncharacterized protein MAM_01068 [Metarhizium album ARSEF 1941]KHO02067.1 hypothetical protein MAM_01068 [Metarhizium album ARSEF 1941]
MKSAVVVAIYAAVAAARPRASYPDKLEWMEPSAGLFRTPPALLCTLPERDSGTELFCRCFGNEAEKGENQIDGEEGRQEARQRPQGPWTSEQDCRAGHKNRPFLLPNPNEGPCDEETGFKKEACGTEAYCQQYREEKKPVPAIFDDYLDCRRGHEPEPESDDN